MIGRKKTLTQRKKKGFFPRKQRNMAEHERGLYKRFVHFQPLRRQNPRDNLGGTDTALSTAYP